MSADHLVLKMNCKQFIDTAHETAFPRGLSVPLSAIRIADDRAIAANIAVSGDLCAARKRYVKSQPFNKLRSHLRSPLIVRTAPAATSGNVNMAILLVIIFLETTVSMSKLGMPARWHVN